MPFVISGFGPSLTFAENAVNAAPATLDADVTVTVVGPSAPLALTVSGLLAEDRVAIRHSGTGAGQIGVDGNAVTYGGVGGTLTVGLLPSATAAAVEALIESLTYANVSDTPLPARALVITMQDAFGDSAVAATVAVTRENDAPVMTSPARITWGENTGGVVYRFTLVDPDGDAIIPTVYTPSSNNIYKLADGTVAFDDPPDFERTSTYTISSYVENGGATFR